MLFANSLQGVAQLIAGKAVALGGNDKEGAAGTFQKLQQIAIALLRRHVDINQGQ